MLEQKTPFFVMLSASNVDILNAKVNDILQQFSALDDVLQICSNAYEQSVKNNEENSVRLAAFGNTKQELEAKLREWQQNKKSINVEYAESMTSNSKLAFAFTGQGAQVAGMGKTLYESNQVFRNSLDECAKILQNTSMFDKPLLSVLWGDNKALINETKYTQPALFSFEYALFKLMASLGIKPQAVLGHSVGEYVAATVTGVMSLEDGLKIISTRASLMQKLPHNGSMLMIPATKEQVEKAIFNYKTQVGIAAVNAHNSIVISGETETVNKVAEIFEDQDIEAIPLVVSHAFHSHLLEPILEPLEEVFKQVHLNDPQFELITNLTGKPAEKGEMSTASYWIKHTRNTVQYALSVEYLLDNNYHTFVEIGPHPVLTGLSARTITKWLTSHNNVKENIIFIATQDRAKDSWDTLAKCLSRLHVAGVDWQMNKLL